MALKKKDYIPYPGLYDLRIFNLNQKEFFAAWKVQDYLFRVAKQSNYYKQFAPHKWEQIKEIATLFQMFLLPRLKQTEILR